MSDYLGRTPWVMGMEGISDEPENTSVPMSYSMSSASVPLSYSRTRDLSSIMFSNMWHLAALGTAGIAAYYETLPPVPNPPLDFEELTGLQWTQWVLHDKKRCIDNFRMDHDSFYELHRILTEKHGLDSLESNSLFESLEALGLFLWAIGTKQTQNQVSHRCGKSEAGVGMMFGEVIEAMFNFAPYVIGPKDSSYSTIHDSLKDYGSFLDPVIGSVDCTHTKVVVCRQDKDAFTNRRLETTQLVIAISDFDMMYTYVGVGLPGGNSDDVALNISWQSSNFPHPPPGRWYLGDKAYCRKHQGYLSPYPNTTRGSAEAVFNSILNKMRGCIERSFGGSKRKWPILKEIPFITDEVKQSKLILAGFLLHNYVKSRTRSLNNYDEKDYIAMNWHFEDVDKVRDTMRDGLYGMGFRNRVA